jgi:ATP adenylyltransferase
MPFVNENNTGHRPDKGQYGNVIKQIAKDGVCPFCKEHLNSYHPNPIDEKEFWFYTDNAYPYSPKKHHKLLILKRHVQHFNDLTEEEWLDLRKIISEETEKLGITGGTVVCRFGDTHFTGASVSHLHAHLFQSNPEDPKYDPKLGVIMRIG